LVLVWSVEGVKEVCFFVSLLPRDNGGGMIFNLCGWRCGWKKMEWPGVLF